MRAAAAVALSAALFAGAAFGQGIVSAHYTQPTDAYGHGALKGGEYAALEVRLSSGQRVTLRYEGAVFEDTAPRLHDFDHDGAPEIVTVLSGFTDGARVQVFGSVDGQVVAFGGNAPIGQAHRWLAIAGIADFNGDGLDEIAYIDRPHLAKTLKLVTVEVDGSKTVFTPLAEAAALTNHHFGAAEIEGGVRICQGDAPVIVTADAEWMQIIETRFVSGHLASMPVADYTGADSFAPFLRCVR